MAANLGSNIEVFGNSAFYLGEDQPDTGEPSSSSRVFTGSPKPSTRLRRCSRICCISSTVPRTGGIFATASLSIAQLTSEAITLSRASGNPRFFPLSTERANTSTITSSFLSLNGAVFSRVPPPAIQLHSCVGEVMPHSHDALGPNRVDVAVMGLLL